jgi:hypothetical protein
MIISANNQCKRTHWMNGWYCGGEYYSRASDGVAQASFICTCITEVSPKVFAVTPVERIYPLLSTHLPIMRPSVTRLSDMPGRKSSS